MVTYELTVGGATQLELVNKQVTTSLSCKEADEKVGPVPTVVLLTRHVYWGLEPPLSGVAVNVTVEPLQTGPDGSRVMLTEEFPMRSSILNPPPPSGILYSALLSLR